VAKVVGLGVVAGSFGIKLAPEASKLEPRSYAQRELDRNSDSALPSMCRLSRLMRRFDQALKVVSRCLRAQPGQRDFEVQRTWAKDGCVVLPWKRPMYGAGHETIDQGGRSQCP